MYSNKTMVCIEIFILAIGAISFIIINKITTAILCLLLLLISFQELKIIDLKNEIEKLKEETK